MDTAYRYGMELWRTAKEYYAQAMQAETRASIELYDRCIDALSKAAEKEEVERNRTLLFLNILQAKANKCTVLANMLKDEAEAFPEQASEYIRDAAYHHLEAVLMREEAAYIAKKIGDVAAYYNLLGCAYQDQAFYHSYIALKTQKANNFKKALKEYKEALRFLEIALQYYNLSLSTSMNEETENNRFQCLKYLENFREDLQMIEREGIHDENYKVADFIFLLTKVREIVDGMADTNKKLQNICELLKSNVSYYDWVGFYYVEQKDLVLRVFAGKPVLHTRIPFGKGICGQVAEKGKTFMVQDVSKETNYLSCTREVKAEIVVPVIKNEEVVGELDIDSHILSPFTEVDKKFLEGVCSIASRLF